MQTADLLTERGKTHGSFEQNAKIAQELRALYRKQPTWRNMPVVHKEALDMMATKLSRILSGQSSHRDHFDDIAGYAKLAADAVLGYDQRQIGATHRECAECGLDFHDTHHGLVCHDCAEKVRASVEALRR